MKIFGSKENGADFDFHAAQRALGLAARSRRALRKLTRVRPAETLSMVFFFFGGGG